MISLVVHLHVRPGHLEQFVAAIRENATRTVRDEPGCLSFDICQDIDDDHHFVLYEVYADRDAVVAHRSMPHFALWRTAADPCVAPGSQQNTLTHQLLRLEKESR